MNTKIKIGKDNEKENKRNEEEFMGQRKNLNKGITLIALVITIIVLLILAGVSIATLTGEDGILAKFHWYSSNYPLCYRGCGYASRTNTLYGFRPILYIK